MNTQHIQDNGSSRYQLIGPMRRPGLVSRREVRRPARQGALRLLASRDGRMGSVCIRQDVELYTLEVQPGAVVELAPRPGRHVLVQVSRGRVQVNGADLSVGLSTVVRNDASLEIVGVQDGEILLFELP